MTTTTTRRLLPVLAALLTAGALTTSGSATTPKFFNDDPVWQEPDTQDASGLKADEVDLFVDLTYNLIAGSGPARGRAGMITYYGTNQLLSKMEHMETPGLDALKPSLPKKPVREQWINIGGQLLRAEAVKEILQFVRSEKINGWDDVHAYYEEEGRQYENQKFQHAYASLLEVHSINCLETEKWNELVQKTLEIKSWMVDRIRDSRAKDYQNEFRKMIYDNDQEMEEVIGRLEDNVFIRQQEEEYEELMERIGRRG